MTRQRRAHLNSQAPDFDSSKNHVTDELLISLAVCTHRPMLVNPCQRLCSLVADKEFENVNLLVHVGSAVWWVSSFGLVQVWTPFGVPILDKSNIEHDLKRQRRFFFSSFALLAFQTALCALGSLAGITCKLV